MMFTLLEPREKYKYNLDIRDKELAYGIYFINSKMQTPQVSEPQSIKDVLKKMGLV